MRGKRYASTPARIYYCKDYGLIVEDSKTWYPNLIRPQVKEVIILEQNQDGNLYINGEKSDYTPLNTTGWGEKEWLLFSSQQEKTYMYFNVYELVCVKDGIKVRNFIPCYSSIAVTDVNGKHCPSGTIGLYDTVEGKFYTNQGEGEFIAGPDVD